MPKKIDEQLKMRAVRLVLEHQSEYSSLSAACATVARQVGVGQESVRRWVRQAEVDTGIRPGTTTAETEEIKKLKAENRRAARGRGHSACGDVFLRGGNSTPATVDDGVRRPRCDPRATRSSRSAEFCGSRAVRLPRTYRSWKRAHHSVAARTVSDALVEDKVREIAWAIDEHDARRKLTPEGLYGRRKMTALVRRHLRDASPGSVDRAMRSLGLVGIRRSKKLRTTIPAKDGRRAGDLLDRDFAAPAPNLVWVADFERHAALLNRVGVRDHHRPVVAAAG